MIGIELELNEEIISAAIPEGVLSLIITQVKNDIEDSVNIDFTGMDAINNNYIDWNSKQLKEGDSLIVRIKKVEEISSPVNIKNIDKQLEREQKLKNYYSLKQSLEKEGLI
jgi:hypothetical protein